MRLQTKSEIREHVALMIDSFPVTLTFFVHHSLSRAWNCLQNDVSVHQLKLFQENLTAEWLCSFDISANQWFDKDWKCLTIIETCILNYDKADYISLWVCCCNRAIEFSLHKQKFVMLTFDILKLECKWLLTFFANCNVRKCEWWSYHDWGVINVVIFLTVIREATAGLTSC